MGKEALLKDKRRRSQREIIGFEGVPEADIYIQSKTICGPGEPVYLDGRRSGACIKVSIFLPTRSETTGYILALKDRLRIGDNIKSMLRCHYY